jgi:hypothetical protein
LVTAAAGTGAARISRSTRPASRRSQPWRSTRPPALAIKAFIAMNNRLATTGVATLVPSIRNGTSLRTAAARMPNSASFWLQAASTSGRLRLSLPPRTGPRDE